MLLIFAFGHVHIELSQNWTEGLGGKWVFLTYFFRKWRCAFIILQNLLIYVPIPLPRLVFIKTTIWVHL